MMADEVKENFAPQFAAKILRSEIAQSDPHLQRDYELLSGGHAIYLKEFFCNKTDFSLLTSLGEELKDNDKVGMTNWSKHFKHENPDFSNTFKSIISKLSDYFSLDVYATRLNFYPDNSSYKPFHHDSHAYGGRALREDFTVGASFGATRSLEFKHVGSEQIFGFPQNNGDVFAFTTKVNTQFQHGVPKETTLKTGPRFSIIAWGRRRVITPRNGGADEQGTRDIEEERHHDNEGPLFEANDDAPIVEEDDVKPMVSDVTELLEKFVLRETSNQMKKEQFKAKNATGNKARRSRVQGGWSAGGRNAKDKTRGPRKPGPR
eukprot:m.15740 g.15740  ORF g.15740 m.15740 type:complete len:319 (+) comp5477_c0_seq1:75-1031(+)